MAYTRRDFMKNATVLGFGTAVLTSSFGCAVRAVSKQPGVKPSYAMVIVDYSKCTGCRTCEAVCSSFNRTQEADAAASRSLGNPYFSNIKVNAYNPDVDVPAVCAMCADNPCVNACPVAPDPKTGRRALYRDVKSGTIRNDPERCIGCGDCAGACKEERTGIIVSDTVTGIPMGMCTLCDGDPQCVKYCPFGALSNSETGPTMEFYGMHPDEIARALTERWYAIESGA